MGVDELIISTLNVNGLGDTDKRRDVFCSLRELKHDIFLLQETHIKQTDENYVRAVWGYELWVAGNSTNKNGVAILFNSTFEYKVHSVTKDPNGCFIIMDVDLQGNRVTLTNIYGPSAGDNPTAIDNVFNLVSQVGNDTVIMGGDWNCLLDPALDARNYSNNHLRPRTRATILNRMSDLDLIDIFRKLYPEKKSYSWRKFNSTKQGRLDFFLISDDLVSNIKRSTISPGYRTDHSLVTISIRKKEFKRDRPFWKFNNSLLKDKSYIKAIKELIEHIKHQYAVILYEPEELKTISAKDVQFSISDQLFFETLLMEIRGKTISYASFKKKTDRENEKILNEKLKSFEQISSITEEQVLELEGIKRELEQLRKKKMEGIAVRCRTTWINEGEKPTHYFCNLENRNFVNKTVSFLEKPDGHVIHDQADILKEAEQFYISLYEKRNVQDINISRLINDAPKLDEIDKGLLKNELTITEIATALKKMDNNKSPGPDGFTVEFFKFFFSDIGDYYTRSIQEGLTNGNLSITQYQGVITCIPKGDKPKQLLKNWRPISLLNVSYKILSACIATRIQKVLPKIIHHCQKGFIKGRYIGDNIRTLFDILSYTKSEDIPGLIVTIDFEKAFDSVAWSFIEKALIFFGFPDTIVKWFKTLYSHPQTCLTFNGQYSRWFSLGRGCRQGDPISPYLYLICAEIMSLMFRQHGEIKGIKLKDSETLLSLFADDTTLFLDGSEESMKNAFQVLDDFSAMSGLKINNEKTQIVWIGRNVGCGIRYLRDRNFIWDPGSFKVLGITFSVDPNNIVRLNFKDKINEVKRDIARWSKRNITPIGKITVIKTLIVSKLTYLLINLPDPPDTFLQEIDRILTQFLWGGKICKIKKSTTYKNYHEGGLKMYNIYSSLSAFKLSWIKRIERYNEEECLSLRLYPCLKKISVFGSAYPGHIRKTIKNQFWLDVLKHLEKLMKIPIKIEQDTMNSISREPLLFNFNLKRGNKVVSNPIWTENNIISICDLMMDDNLSFINFETFRTRYVNTPGINFLEFNGIVRAARQFLTRVKNNPDNTNLCSFWVWDAIRAGNFKVRAYFNQNDVPPTATLKWNTHFPGLVWKTIFVKCFKTTIDTQLQWFQARILHRILPTRRYLSICKIVNSPNCLFCDEYEESLCHLFWECSHVKKFWIDLEDMLKRKCYNCARFSFRQELVVFGTSANIITDRAIDFLILLAKFYIYKCRFIENIPNCLSFISNLKKRLEIEKLLAIRRNKYSQFQLMWYPYLGLFE